MQSRTTQHSHRRPPARSARRWLALLAGIGGLNGCVVGLDPPASQVVPSPVELSSRVTKPEKPATDANLRRTTDDQQAALPSAIDETEALRLLQAGELPPPALHASPLPDLIQTALDNNRRVQAARWEVMAMRARVPQVTSLEDPMLQNGVWPFPMNGPQFALMGYMPYDLMISQQFPWLGTLRLRGRVAMEEARVALLALAEAQLDVVAEVKRAYAALRAAERTIAVLDENRRLAGEIVELTRIRLEAGGNQQDVLRSEVAVAVIDRDLVEARRAVIVARAELIALMHLPPGSDLAIATTSGASDPRLPTQAGQLYDLAVAARPELQARLAEVERDKAAISLARKRFLPDVTVGLAYQTMTRENNPSPQADGRDNVGFNVGFNLPVYRQKYRAGVYEAQARARADSMRYEADRDQAWREVTAAWAEVQASRETLELLNNRIAPKSRLALEGAVAGYRAGSLDYVTMNTAREELQEVETQLVRAEAELERAVADLERAVGTGLGEVAASTPIEPDTTP